MSGRAKFEYEELLKEVVPRFDDFVDSFKTSRLYPDEDPLMIAHKVANDGKWPDEYYKMVARTNKEIMDTKTTDCWSLLYKWCIDSK